MSRQLLVVDIKGVGEKTSAALESAGITTALDVINWLPRRYEDYSKTAKLAHIQPGKVVVKGRLSGVSERRVRRGMSITQATLSDDTAKVAITWFNQPYRKKQIEKGGEWVLSGEFTLSNGKYQIMNPSVKSSSEIIDEGSQIVPIYRQVKGLKTDQFRKIVEELRPRITMLPELLPDALLREFDLLSYADAMIGMHFPTSKDTLQKAQERIAFQELFELVYASVLNRQDAEGIIAPSIQFNGESAKEFTARLPFTLTDHQKRASWEILQDIEKTTPMNRLLQGDVGAGKTVVAAMAAFMAAENGFQTAFMAPTELLAVQHAESLSRMLEPHNISVALLTGSVTKKLRSPMLESIKSGATAIIVGTHALIQDTVQYHNLGLVVIDEQHRFGVAQRQKLLQKANEMPHLLAMTATPIPRSLQLTVYGELDVSLIRQKPSGRKEIITEITSPVAKDRLYKQIDGRIAAGRQVYVVCPLIEDGPDSERKSVESEMALLKKTVFSHRRIGQLHGKMPAEEKQLVMKQFAGHELDILVATTVIEVGVDVPNATIMIIEGADRFGLAQLHQLRGRVGRGAEQSYCYLVPTEAKSPLTRLRELERSNDGFYLAEKDLELRGPGEIYGRAQHGVLNLQVANLADMTLLRKVKDAIAYIEDEKIDLLQYEGLKQRIERNRKVTTLN